LNPLGAAPPEPSYSLALRSRHPAPYKLNFWVRPWHRRLVTVTSHDGECIRPPRVRGRHHHHHQT